MSVIKVKNEQGSFEEISTLTGPQGLQGNPCVGIAEGVPKINFLQRIGPAIMIQLGKIYLI